MIPDSLDLIMNLQNTMSLNSHERAHRVIHRPSVAETLSKLIIEEKNLQNTYTPKLSELET